MSVDSTVMCITRMQYIPPPPDPMQLKRLVSRTLDLTRELQVFVDSRWAPMHRRLSQLHWAADDIRVPLDVPRTGVRSLDWRPFGFEDMKVTSQLGLVQILRHLRDNVVPHTGQVPTGHKVCTLQMHAWSCVVVRQHAHAYSATRRHVKNR